MIEYVIGISLYVEGSFMTANYVLFEVTEIQCTGGTGYQKVLVIYLD